MQSQGPRLFGRVKGCTAFWSPFFTVPGKYQEFNKLELLELTETTIELKRNTILQWHDSLLLLLGFQYSDVPILSPLPHSARENSRKKQWERKSEQY